MLKVKNILMQRRKEEIQIHAKIQLVKIIKIIAAPSKIPLKQKQLGSNRLEPLRDRNGKYYHTFLLILNVKYYSKIKSKRCVM